MIAHNVADRVQNGSLPAAAAPPLSAVIITMNNEATIGHTLKGLAWCDEIVVVDSGSTDRTVEICEAHHCRVLHHKFEGFGRQKHFAVAAAKHDWVLVVDSDETLTDKLRDEIQRRLTSGDVTLAGFQVPVTLVFMGRVMRFGGAAGTQIRLFNRAKGNFNFAEVHEGVELAGPVGTLRGRILNPSYRDVQHYLEKFNRYTSLAAHQAFDRGRHTSPWRIALRFPSEFCMRYFVRGAILDGYPGFVWSLLSAFYPTIKYIKLRELWHSRQPTAQ